VRASVIIVNYNGGRYLQDCLNHLARQSVTAFEALVVDNASTDLSRLRTVLPDHRFRWIDAGSNLGFAAANNLAATQARGAWLVCLNPDAFAAPDWLAQLLDTAEAHGVAMAGSLQVDAGDPDTLDGAGDMYSGIGVAWRALHGLPKRELAPVMEVFAPCAAASAYRRDVFHAAGGFDARFFCYHEDVDLALRLRLAGHRCLQVNRAVVRHVGSGLSGKRSEFAVRLGSRNRLWTFLKSYPAPWMWWMLPLHVAASLAWVVASLPKGGAGPGWRGLVEGVRGAGPFLADRAAVQATRVQSPGLWAMMMWNPLRLLTRALKGVPVDG